VCEVARAKKNWFVTLTLRRNMSDGVGYRFVQRWLKRLRKFVSVRYACVAEHGLTRTMRLHYHVVLSGGPELTQRVIRSTWRGGISEATLIVSGAAGHAARYSSKMARYVTKGGARFRFSQGYGSAALRELASRGLARKVCDVFPGAQVVRVAGVRLSRKLRSAADPPFVPTVVDWDDVREARASAELVGRLEEGLNRPLFLHPKSMGLSFDNDGLDYGEADREGD